MVYYVLRWCYGKDIVLELRYNFILWVCGVLDRFFKDFFKYGRNESKYKMYRKINRDVEFVIEFYICFNCLMYLIYRIMKFRVDYIFFYILFFKMLFFFEEWVMIYYFFILYLEFYFIYIRFWNNISWINE